MSYESLPENSLFVEKYVKAPTYSKVLGIICLVIAVTVIIVSIYLYAFTGRVIPFDYGIVIDAGSSHTQSFLYRWLGSKDSGTGLVGQENSCNYNCGIASMPDPTPVVICTEVILKSVPNIIKMKTPLYLGATAGMRLLEITEPEEVNLRLIALRYALKQTQVDVKDVGIITGHDEGMCSWITVNFLAETLNLKKSIHAWNSTYGALDLGGASTQFSYAVDPRISNKSTDVTPLKLYGTNYEILAKSFLCFGMDQAFIRHQALLIKDFNSTESITDPCLPKGYFSVSDAHSLLAGPCTSTPEFEKWLDVFGLQNKTFTFQGGSDFEKCKANVDAILNESFCQEKGFSRCSERTNISSSGIKFMAFSSFSYVLTFLNASNAPLKEIVDITTSWCRLSWKEIDPDQYKPDIRPHLPKYCFGGVYIIQWLTENYGFDETSWSNIIFQDKIQNTDIGWSLGYMINATNAIPEEEVSPPSISVAVLVLLLILGFILLTFGFIFFFKHSKLTKALSYSRFE